MDKVEPLPAEQTQTPFTDRVSKSFKRAKSSAASDKTTSEQPKNFDLSQLVGLGLNIGGSLLHHPYSPPLGYPYNHPYTPSPTHQPFPSYPFVFASPYIPNNPFQHYYTGQTPMFGVGGQLGFQQSVGLGSTYPASAPTTPYYPTTYPPMTTPQQMYQQQQLLQQQQQQLLLQQLQQQQQWQQQWQLTTQPPNCSPNMNYYPPTYGPTNSPPRPITLPENNYNNYNNNYNNNNNNPDEDGQYGGSYESNITPPSNTMYGFKIRLHPNNTIASTVAAANGQNWPNAGEKQHAAGQPTRRPIIGLPADDDEEIESEVGQRIGVNLVKSLVG